MDVEIEFGGRTIAGTTRDLSLGGAFVDVSDPAAAGPAGADSTGAVPQGARVLLRFRVPAKNTPIEAAGEVRWIEGSGGLGVRFDGLRARDAWAVGLLLKAHGGT